MNSYVAGKRNPSIERRFSPSETPRGARRSRGAEVARSRQARASRRAWRSRSRGRPPRDRPSARRVNPSGKDDVQALERGRGGGGSRLRARSPVQPAGGEHEQNGGRRSPSRRLTAPRSGGSPRGDAPQRARPRRSCPPSRAASAVVKRSSYVSTGTASTAAERVDERARLARLLSVLAAQGQRQPDDDELGLLLARRARAMRASPCRARRAARRRRAAARSSPSGRRRRRRCARRRSRARAPSLRAPRG